MLSFSCFLEFILLFCQSSGWKAPLLFLAAQLPRCQAAFLSSLGNECPLLDNTLIANSGSIRLVTKQNFLGREQKKS